MAILELTTRPQYSCLFVYTVYTFLHKVCLLPLFPEEEEDVIYIIVYKFSVHII